MSFFMFRKRASSRSWVFLCQNPKPSKPQTLSNSIEKQRISDCGLSSFSPKTSKIPSGSLQNRSFSSNVFVSSSKPLALSSGGALGIPMVKSLYSSLGGLAPRSLVCLFGTQAAVEPSTCDGLTVDRIIASEWPILDEDESDWKSHAAAITQSIHLIKKRLQWKKLQVRLDLLSVELNRPDLWNDPVHAGKISREHGSLTGKMKEVRAFERELLEHVDMVKLAREENDAELESESMKALLEMRRTSKEKEIEALLAGEHDPCSCYIEVQAGAGGTEGNDWAAMVMEMYKMWAQRRGYKVTVVDEMAGDIAGIKVQLLTILQSNDPSYSSIGSMKHLLYLLVQ